MRDGSYGVRDTCVGQSTRFELWTFTHFSGGKKQWQVGRFVESSQDLLMWVAVVWDVSGLVP
eukprot:5165391-Ditylum_brightwellii.AAC.1